MVLMKKDINLKYRLSNIKNNQIITKQHLILVMQIKINN